MDEKVLYLLKFYGVLRLKSVRRQLTQIIIIVIYKTKIKFYIIFVSTWRAGSLIHEQKFSLVQKFYVFMFYICGRWNKNCNLWRERTSENKPLYIIDQGKLTKNKLR
jgi:hypothetical protein